jgi:uncharacterized Fe-S cluster protein YjdI
MKEVNPMSDKVKNKIKAAGIIVVIAALTFVASAFIAVSTEGCFTEGGGCIAIVFDKADVMGADKIVVYDGDEVITISDEAHVREIASEFVVANRTALCESRSGDKLEIYNSGKLVRTVYWSDCVDNFAHIYEKDATHWIFPGEGDLGQVELSRDAFDRINQIIEGYREEI